MVESQAEPVAPERKKVRIRVMKTSRTWRWKVIGAICLAGVLLVGCAIYVPRWLSSLASDSGGGSSTSESPPSP